MSYQRYNDLLHKDIRVALW